MGSGSLFQSVLMPRTIESVLIDGPAGKLEAIVENPEGGTPGEVALVCHPHPLYGGTMHNKVVHRLARGLRRNGAAVLRFNFRGAGRSEGVHDKGKGEVDDARVCLGWLRDRYPGLLCTVAGFSFGGWVIARLGSELLGAARAIIVGVSPRMGYAGLHDCPIPKVLIQSTHDQFGPRPEVEALFASLPEPKDLIFIEAEDHFFGGALDRFEEAVATLGPALRTHRAS